MKIVARMSLQDGMILGEDVKDSHGNVLYTAGTEINARVINKLNRYSIMCVTIMEDIDFAQTHYERMRFDNTFKAFEIIYTDCLNRYKEMMTIFLNTGTIIENNKLLSLYHNVMSSVPGNAAIFDYLYIRVPNEDEMTLTHCFNSALIAGTFADWLLLNEEEKNTLILCGFYYDIGKLMLPYHLLWKPGKLTAEEYEQIKSHTVTGYKLLRMHNINPNIKRSVVLHHERLDGSGYPYGFDKEEIDIYSRCISIIDTYEAMAAPRAHRLSIPPLNILAYFEEALSQYDVELLMPIMKNIANMQIGTNVQLSDESIWEVFLLNNHKLSRPILRNEKSEMLDLSIRPDLKIEKVI